MMVPAHLIAQPVAGPVGVLRVVVHDAGCPVLLVEVVTEGHFLATTAPTPKLLLFLCSQPPSMCLCALVHLRWGKIQEYQGRLQCSDKGNWLEQHV